MSLISIKLFRLSYCDLIRSMPTAATNSVLSAQFLSLGPGVRTKVMLPKRSVHSTKP